MQLLVLMTITWRHSLKVKFCKQSLVRLLLWSLNYYTTQIWPRKQNYFLAKENTKLSVPIYLTRIQLGHFYGLSLVISNRVLLGRSSFVELSVTRFATPAGRARMPIFF
jgi:hypothetical protein